MPGRVTPRNYDLTFSFSGTNETASRRELERGRRVAVVFLGMRHKGGEWHAIGGAGKRLVANVPLPENFWGIPVVDGDESDLRALDPGGVIVGLRYKNPHGQKINPADPSFAFVTPAFVVDGASGLERPTMRNPPGVEYLITAVASRSTGFRGEPQAPIAVSGDVIDVDYAGELGL